MQKYQQVWKKVKFEYEIMDSTCNNYANIVKSWKAQCSNGQGNFLLCWALKQDAFFFLKLSHNQV